MAEKINDGGPAFPEAYVPDGSDPSSGMTLRDYFAAKAMQGLLQRGWVRLGDNEEQGDLVPYDENVTETEADTEVGVDVLARDAYTIADMMIAARND